MAGSKTRSERGRKRRRGKRASRGRLLRLLAASSSVVAVVAAAVSLYLYVDVTTRFEGRLWKLPSRIYADATVLRPGAALGADALVRRLERAGYARSADSPTRPGQFRVHGRTVEILPRPVGPRSAGAAAPRAVAVRFDGTWISSIRELDGRRVARLELEPELIAAVYGPRQEDREVVRLGQVPERFVHAVLAAEDARFYDHGGVDLRAVLRAAAANLRSGRIVQGGSTVTQQTVKNLFLGQQRTWWRKLRELPMSVLLDLRYPKDRILEVYLNEVYLGQRGSVAICGVQAAARFYFGRDLGDLTTGESALLAGLIKSPGRYNPFVNPERALERRDQVLEAMHRAGFIDAAELERARAERVELGSGGGGFTRAPYIVDYAIAQVSELYPRRVLEEQGLSIVTTVDTLLQESAERALSEGLERLEREAPLVRRQRGERTLQGALVVLDPRSGAIRAMVGGRDYKSSQFNRAVQARRQPGSCFKPFVFAAAFERAIAGEPGGLTPASRLDDEPIELLAGGRPWRPENYDGLYRGPVSVRVALERSLNVPTVRAAQQVGLERVVDLAGRAGIESALRPLPSLALGTLEVTPLELAAAYATLANQGVRVRPHMVREVRDSAGEPVQSREVEVTRAIDPRAAYLVTDVLQGVLERGTGESALWLGFTGRAAGKTGTTDETRDSWFVGYTPELLALVWVGFDDNARTGLGGSSGALPIWVDFMKRAGLARSAQPFPEPPGIVERWIDPESGDLSVRGCPLTERERFAAGTEPSEPCRLHKRGVFRWLRNLGRRRAR